MDKNTKIDQKIKESFSQQEMKAPTGLWSSLNAKLDQDDALNAKVKSSFEENFEDKAPERVWSGIERQLTIDSGWKKVHRYLQYRTIVKWTKRVAAFLIFLFFFLPDRGESLRFNTATKTVAKNNEENKSVEHSVDQVQEEDSEIFEEQLTVVAVGKTNGQRANLLSKQTSSKNKPDLITDPIKISANVSDGHTKTTQESDVFLQNSKGIDSLVAVKEKDEDTNGVDRLAIRSLGDLNSSLKTTQLKPTETNQLSKFQVGVTASFSATSIVNNTTREAFDKESLVTYLPSFGNSFGVQLGYQLNANHALLSDVSYTTINQTYDRFGGGDFVREELTANFYRFQLLYSYTFARKVGKTARFNLKAGMFGETIRKATYVFDESETYDYSKRFRPVDLGISLQLGQLYERNQFVFDYGLHYNQGLTNIYKGSATIPATFNRTTTSSLGIYVSIRRKL